MTFDSGENFAFTPDGKHIVFTAVPEKDEAWSTNFDLFQPLFYGGARFQFSPKVGMIVRIGSPSLTIGANFLL